jgi:hypothetical protein
MAQKYNKMLLTVRKKLELLEKFENRETGAAAAAQAIITKCF